MKMQFVIACLVQIITGVFTVALHNGKVPPSAAVQDILLGIEPVSTSVLCESTAPCAPIGNSYMVVANKWRSRLGKGALVHDPKLESNAKDTVISSNGRIAHKLNTGTYAQVLAPGNVEDFEDVFVGGWLCERASLPGLDGICTTLSRGWDYRGQTGHADILTSLQYSKMGCGWHAGIWACDLA